MDIGEAEYLSAIQLIAAYRDARLDPVDVVEHLLERIGKRDRGLGSVVALDGAGARAAAGESESRWRRGVARTLEGVPVLVKDMIDTAGLTTTYGSRLFAAHRPARDAEAVRRLRAAGAIVLGKAATHEFAWGITTESSAHGVTRNPWDTTRVPGGSSGGSAAALAAGFAPLALGTDTAGSIRIPAALCGVAGLKPTHGAVAADGVFALAPSLDHVGPMARTVADLRLADHVLREAGPSDKAGGRPLRVGILEPFGRAPLPDATATELERAAIRLRARGHVTRPISVPRLERAYPTLATFVACEGLAVHRAAGLYPSSADAYLPGVRYRLDLAATRSQEELRDAMAERRQLTNTVSSLFSEVDAVVSAVVATQPALIGHDAEPGSAATSEFRQRVMAYTTWASLTGVPACTVPAGLDADGLPIGLQLCAPWRCEGRLLALAEIVEAGLAYPSAT